ncbi:MAG: hypothetical protein KBC30_03315 [Planctomycetes bacterium]|nr:hypothetical protein [Planctomycetota bacterium]HQA99515.1 hypothetical protein [Planctomycetota bacterium]
MNYNLYFFICICCLLCSCGTFSRNYEQGMKYVHQDSSLSESDFKNGLKAFNKAIQDAELKILDADLSVHDQYSMIISLSWIGKAKLYQRMNQIVEMESACWKAMKVAEEMVGKHIQTQKLGSFVTYNVYFRREKIRRYAFNILHEIYQKVGEKDLVSLMQLQMSMSSNYLNSKFAYEEEKNIRRLENASWQMNLSDEKENIFHGAVVVLMTVSEAARQTSIAIQQQQLESQYHSTENVHVRRELADRMQRLEEESYWSHDMYIQRMDKERERHKEAKLNIQHEFQSTLEYSLQANFKNLQLSPELKRLPSYHRLQSQAQQLDNYMAQHGFDLDAAKELVQFRKTLDDLTREAQEQAKKSRSI